MTQADALYSVAQVRDFEAQAIAAGTAGYALMQRAGAAALQVLRSHWPAAQHLAVVCGGGNNGGDGYVLARLAVQAGLQVQVLAAADVQQLAGDARTAWQDAVAAGLVVQPFAASALQQAEVVVDALLGTGTRLPLRAAAAAAIAALNAAGKPVLALDVPSGLDADSGLGDPVVRAQVTVSFVGLKTGLCLNAGPDHCGQLVLEALELDMTAVVPRLQRLTRADIAAALPPRQREAHKGRFGSVLVIGGGPGMPGAVSLAAESALRAGAGRVTVASLSEHLAAVVGPRPELMFAAADDTQSLQQALAAADVVAIGPGLGTSAWAQSLLQSVLAQMQPGQQLVVDADALNLLAALPQPLHRDDWILTPHPGEAARLLGLTTAAVQADRPAAVHALQQRWGGVVVLKGAGTLIAAAGQVTALCDRGNPGMAIPGMGDVLTGAVAGILAQCRERWLAARAAVLAHAMAGDLCAATGQRGLLAGDVVSALHQVVNP